MRKLIFFLFLGVFAASAPACDLLKAYGDAWGNADPPMCNPVDGAGGDTGAGGDGAGGDDGEGDTGDTGAGADVATGAGTGSGAGASDPGSGADVAAGAGAGPGEARRPPRLRRRGRKNRSGIGIAELPDCPAPSDPIIPTPPQPVMAPKPMPLVGLDTVKLRAIAAYLGIGQGKTGVQLNRAIGLAFEDWVLTMLGQKANRWRMLISSPARKSANQGLPASVIPEFVSDLTLFSTDTGITPFPLSEFWEVKAVTGPLFLSTSQYQILGLVDVARLSPAGMSTLPKHPPPVVVFTTTSNTTISPGVLMQATQWGVAIWQQTVAYDATNPNDPNPDLYIGPLGSLNQDVYPAGGLPKVSVLNLTGSKLNSPTSPPLVVPNDPDPPEVN